MANIVWPEQPDDCGGIVPATAGFRVYTRGPSPEALQNTPTGRGSRRSGTVSIRYCVNESGRVESAEVEGHFPGDPKIDEVVLRAVRRWRVDPGLVEHSDPCSSIDFAIEFD